MIYFILIAVYFLSAVLMWRYLHLSHSKGGIWEDLHIKGMDVFFMIVPFFNTLACVIGWVFYYPKKSNFDNFFNLKK